MVKSKAFVVLFGSAKMQDEFLFGFVVGVGCCFCEFVQV